MRRKARIHYVSIHSSLVNLPISIYGPLLERSIRPQSLAVHLTLVSASNAKVEAYVGWTGLASASSLAHFNSTTSAEKGFETIEIDPQYAQGLGLTQGDLVEIGLLHDLPLAKSVGTEPLTSDDWEIIEINASHVESTLLSQVRVAKIGQEIDVWVLGRTRVRLRITSLDPPSKNNALLLTTDTEVSIAPKLHRPSNPSSTSTAPHSKSGPVKSPSSTSTAAKSVTLRVLPSRVCPASFNIHAHTGTETLAFVAPSTFTRLCSAEGPTPPPFLRPADRATVYKTTLYRLLPPSDPLAPPPAIGGPAPGPAPRILNPGKEKEPEIVAGEMEDPGVWVGWLECIPDDHIVFPHVVGSVEEWDLVRLTCANNGTSKTVEEGVVHAGVTNQLSSSKTNFLAGVDDIMSKCTEYCMRQFALHASSSVILGVSALLLTGREGAGKTSIARAVAKNLEESSKLYAYTHYVDVSRHTELPIAKVRDLFKYWLTKAAWHRPTVLILDNIDKLLGVELEHADSFRTRHITELFLALYSSSARTASRNTRGIILIGTASSSAALHSLLGSAHIFDEIVAVKAPNRDARRDILARIVERRLEAAGDIQQDPESPLNFAALATVTEGYSATDLQDLVARAVHQAAIRSVREGEVKVTIGPADFVDAQVDFVPLSLRDVKLQKSDVAWSDIGGLQETKKVLRETLEWPTKYGPIFAQSPLRLRSGLMLYGFPGCGKTLLASAVARECGLNFISVKGPELLNKYIGASEKSVRDIFERASAAKPCVLFFDEFDSIAPKRGHDSTGVTDRVVNQMLTQMDGAEGLDGVYVLAATSRPDLIDSALLRPGRLDKSLFCNMPNTAERVDILQAVGRKVSISPSVDLQEIAEATEGYSGADLQALVYNAHLEVIHASIAAIPQGNISPSTDDETPIEYTTFGGPTVKSVVSKAEETALQQRLRQIRSTSESRKVVPKAPLAAPKKREITAEHLRKVLKSTQPSVSLEEQQRLGRIYHAFVSDRSGELPIPPDSGGVGNRVSLM